MRTLSSEVEDLLQRHGVIARSAYPELSGTIAWLRRTGRLVPVLPGVYAHPSVAATSQVRLQAVSWWNPDAVLVGAAAARVSYWPALPLPLVTCAVQNRHPPQPGFAFVRRTIPTELIAERRRLRYTRPALTALDLCVETEGAAIDEVLRTRAATLEHLHAALALVPDRPGNRERRRLLLQSRAQPWSASERRMHRLLREARITGWDGNQPVMIDGRTVYPDVLFAKLRLIIEIDGRRFHAEPEVFESDRRRQNLFVINGWHVLRFTVRMIEDEPDLVIATVRAALSMLGPSQ